jgi:hypothetical protein
MSLKAIMMKDLVIVLKRLVGRTAFFPGLSSALLHLQSQSVIAATNGNKECFG